MVLTKEEEDTLKLFVADIKAKAKLDIQNQLMGNEIRAEFGTIDTRIRGEYNSIITSLQQDVVSAQLALKEIFE